MEVSPGAYCEATEKFLSGQTYTRVDCQEDGTWSMQGGLEAANVVEGSGFKRKIRSPGTEGNLSQTKHQKFEEENKERLEAQQKLLEKRKSMKNAAARSLGTPSAQKQLTFDKADNPQKEDQETADDKLKDEL